MLACWLKINYNSRKYKCNTEFSHSSLHLWGVGGGVACLKLTGPSILAFCAAFSERFSDVLFLTSSLPLVG